MSGNAPPGCRRPSLAASGPSSSRGRLVTNGVQPPQADDGVQATQADDGVQATQAGQGRIDHDRIERAVREILEAIGEDPDREGLQRTPQRVAAMYAEVFDGLHDSPDQHLSVTFSADHDEMVMIKDIPMYSMCEHHLTPFIGRAHLAYIPNVDGRIT